MTETASNVPTAEKISALSEDLAGIADRLAEALSRETELVRAMRVTEIGALQADKTALAALYQKTFRILVAAHGGKPFAPAVKRRLAAVANKLSAAVSENELMLRVGKVATERLITTIVAAVREEQRSSSAYAPQRAPIARRGFMTAAALDRRL
ncbi:MAG: hypothetical protein ACREFL_00655 [Stellaceae bacterium]